LPKSNLIATKIFTTKKEKPRNYNAKKQEKKQEKFSL